MNRLRAAALLAISLVGVAAIGVRSDEATVTITRWVMGGGEDTRSAATMRMQSTTGQPVIGLTESGPLQLGWGYWHPVHGITETAAPTPASTGTPTATGPANATATPEGNASGTPTDAPSGTPDKTPAATASASPTVVPDGSPTPTRQETLVATKTPWPSKTPLPSKTPDPDASPQASGTPGATTTPTPNLTATAKASLTPGQTRVPATVTPEWQDAIFVPAAHQRHEMQSP